MARLVDQIGELALHANSSVLDAMNTPMSMSADFFGSSAFADFRKLQEARQRMSGAILQQVGNVTSSISGLAKALVRR